MKWLVLILVLVCSFQSFAQGDEYVTMEEIEEMRGRMQELGYDSAFIETSLKPYIEKAKIKLIVTKFNGTYLKKFQQLKISNCSEIEGDDFCTKYIVINGVKVNAYTTTNNLVFNLRPLDLPLGCDLNIELYHKEGCTPLVTNASEFIKEK